MAVNVFFLRLRTPMVLFFFCQVQVLPFTDATQGTDSNVRAVYFSLPSDDRTVLKAGPAMFGVDLVGKTPTEAKLTMVEPPKGCEDITNGQNVSGKIALVYRGDCMFIEKAVNIQKTGAVASIVIDNDPGITAERSSVFVMHHGYKDDDVTIPMVFLYAVEASVLLDAYRQQPELVVGVADVAPSAVGETEETTVTVSNTEGALCSWIFLENVCVGIFGETVNCTEAIHRCEKIETGLLKDAGQNLIEALSQKLGEEALFWVSNSEQEVVQCPPISRRKRAACPETCYQMKGQCLDKEECEDLAVYICQKNATSKEDCCQNSSTAPDTTIVPTSSATDAVGFVNGSTELSCGGPRCATNSTGGYENTTTSFPATLTGGTGSTTASLTTSATLIGDKEIKIIGLVGEEAELPCDINEESCGKVYFITWTKNVSKIWKRLYLYSDAISKPLNELANPSRAEFTLGESSGSLRIVNLRLEDDGIYKCDVTYVQGKCPSLSYATLFIRGGYENTTTSFPTTLTGQKSGESVQRGDETTGAGNRLSSDYIDFRVISVLIMIALTISAASCYQP